MQTTKPTQLILFQKYNLTKPSSGGSSGKGTNPDTFTICSLVWGGETVNKTWAVFSIPTESKLKKQLVCILRKS